MSQDLATKTFDLSRAVMDIVNSSSPVGKAAVEIIQWLGRERIDKSDYEYCLTRSRALTVPNEYGLEIRSSILNVEKQMTRPGGLQLLLPSSIGRWMSFSADHCYMVTTVAAVTKFHDFDYAINLLCDMILVDGNPNSDQLEYTYSVHQTRLKGILSKVVNSIALNVVNPGHDLGQLPQELSGYCVHLTDHQTFASIVLTIQRSKEDMLLYCARFQGDLFVWLSAHFEGIIEVSIAGKTVFEKATKSGKRKMMILARETCTPEIDCHDARTVHSIELSKRYEDRWEQIFQGKDDSGRGRAPTPAQRQPLYTMKHSPFSGLNEILNRKELHEIKLAAQSIIKWLLGVTLKPHLEAGLFGFATVLKGESDSVTSTVRIGEILYRWPSITQDFEDDLGGVQVYAGTPVEMAWDSDSDSTISDTPRVRSTSEILAYFPVVRGILERTRIRCACLNCRERGTTDRVKLGCLQEAAVSQLFMLLGNAIADGFGAEGASGMMDLGDYNCQVARLLSELIDGGVWWDTWFNLAASTMLGCSTKDGRDLYDSGSSGGSALVAVQYGSLIAVARWLDMTKDLSVHGCFGFEIAEGQLKGLQGDLALVQTEIKMKTTGSPPTSNLSDADKLLAALEVDKSSAVVQTAIIGTDKSQFYRLLTLIGSDPYKRIVDPAEAIMSLSRSYFPQCSHSETLPNGYSIPDSSIWSFSELLGDWAHKNDQKSTYLTRCLDSDLKVNVALSLTVEGSVLRSTGCCLKCALEALDKHPSQTGRRIISRQVDSRRLAYKSATA